MLKLKLQLFGYLMWRTDSLKKTLMLGKIEGGGEGDGRGWDGWMASPTRWIWVWAGSGNWWWTGKPGVLSPWGHRVGHDWATELNSSTGSMITLKIKAQLFPNTLVPSPANFLLIQNQHRINMFISSGTTHTQTQYECWLLHKLSCIHYLFLGHIYICYNFVYFCISLWINKSYCTVCFRHICIFRDLTFLKIE